jgi:hypothetical protein
MTAQTQQQEKGKSGIDSDPLIFLPNNQTLSDGVGTAIHSSVPPERSYLDTNRDKKQMVSYPHSREGNRYVSESNAKMGTNTLLSFVDDHSKMKLLKHKMNQLDISKSGYLSRSEFTASLNRVGANLTPAQVNALFDANAQKSIGRATQSLTSIDIFNHRDGVKVNDFIQKLQTRGSAASRSQRRSNKRVATSSTPIEEEDRLIWKRVVDSLQAESGAKRSIDFFKHVQVPTMDTLTHIHT